MDEHTKSASTEPVPHPAAARPRPLLKLATLVRAAVEDGAVCVIGEDGEVDCGPADAIADREPSETTPA